MKNFRKGIGILLLELLYVVVVCEAFHGHFGGQFGYNPPQPTTTTTTTTPGTTVETEFEAEETTVPATTTTTTTTTVKPPVRKSHKRPPPRRQEHQPEPHRQHGHRQPHIPPRRPQSFAKTFRGQFNRFQQQNFNNVPTMPRGMPPRNFNSVASSNARFPQQNYIVPNIPANMQRAVNTNIQRPLNTNMQRAMQMGITVQRGMKTNVQNLISGQSAFNRFNRPNRMPLTGSQHSNNGQVTFNTGPAYNFAKQAQTSARVNTHSQSFKQPAMQQMANQIRQKTTSMQTAMVKPQKSPPVSKNIPPFPTSQRKRVGEQCPTYRYTVDNNFVEFHTVPGACKIQIMYPPGGNGPPKVQFLAKVAKK